MKRKICILTGTRAEYGLLKGILGIIKNSSDLELQLIVTGMHLSPEFGLTYKFVQNDGFHIDRKVEILMSSDTPVGISKSMGIAMIGFAEALDDLKPDLLVLLGDRFESFAAAAVAQLFRIPIAHLHGGEITEGLVDEAYRHSITKMSHLHFVAAPTYYDRVAQLGEDPEHIYLVGGLGVDRISAIKLIDKKSLQDKLGITFEKRVLLVTFHPVTLDKSSALEQLRELLKALGELNDVTLIFTYPNTDTDGRIIIDLIVKFVSKNKNAHVFSTMGEELYLSCLAVSDGVIGNSSSGLLEAPTLRKGAINIGDRQKGRLQASSVINSEPNYLSISSAIEILFSPEFQDILEKTKNPYGSDGASKKIVNILKNISLDGLIKKKFHDQ